MWGVCLQVKISMNERIQSEDKYQMTTTTTKPTTKYYTLGDLKQQKCIFSQSWRLEVQDQGAGRAGFFWDVCPSCCVLMWVSLCVCVWILISFSYKDTVTPDQGHLLGCTWRPTSPVAQLWDQRKTAGTMTETSTVYQTEDLSSPKHKVLRSSAATPGMTQLVGLVLKQL